MIQRIFKIIILLPNLFYRLFQKRNGPIKNIVIIQMAKLGDMVCTTPMFRAIKKVHPEWRLTIVGNAVNEKLLNHNGDIDEYLVWNRNTDLSYELRKRNTDTVIIPGPNGEALFYSLKAGISRIFVSKIQGGWSPYETITFRFLRFFVESISLRMNFYTPREYLYLLEPIGIESNDTKKHLGYSKEAEIYAEKIISQYKDVTVAGITLTAGNKIKEWEIEKFSKVAKELIKNGLKIIIFGGDNDAEYSKEFIGFFNDDEKNSILNTVGVLSVDQLKALISKVDIFVGVDTGPIYVAEAFGVPTVDILGPMSELEQPPVSEKNRIVYLKERKEPMLHIMNARVYDEKEAKRQISEITVNMVLDEINKILPLNLNTNGNR